MGQNMSDCTGCRNENNSTFFGCNTKPISKHIISNNIFNNGDYYVNNKLKRKHRRRFKKTDL